VRRLLSFGFVMFAVAFAASVMARGGTPAPGAIEQAAAPPVPPAIVAQFEKTVKPFVAEFCYACHGNKGEPKHGLNIEQFQTADSLIEHRTEWEDIAAILRRSEMPPLEEDQPDEERRQAVSSWLRQEFARIDRVTPPDPGRVTARRLNRTEYNNTIRDLIGLDLQPADDFPQDDSGYGFDNIADVLSLSPVLMEKYVTSAERIARHALFGPPAYEPTLVRLRSRAAATGAAREFPERYDLTGLSLSNAFHGVHRVPVDGEYLVRVFLGGVRPLNSDPITLALWVDDEQVATLVHDPEKYGRFEIDRQDFGGQTADFRVTLAAGERRLGVAIPRIFEGLPARLNGPNPSTRPDPPREFTPPPNAPPERIALFRKRFEEAQAALANLPLDAVRVNTLEVGGPYTHATGPSPESLAKVYTCGHSRRRASARVRHAHHDRLREARVPPAGGRPRDGAVHRSRAPRAGGGAVLRGGPGGGPPGDSRLARLPLPDRAGPQARPLGHLPRDQPARAGLAALLLPLGEHAGRRAAAGGRQGDAPAAAGAGGPDAADAARPEGRRAGGALRRAVAPVPRARVAHARPRPVPRLRGLPPLLDAARDGALHRARHPRGPQRPRLPRRPLHVRQRASGAALRHPDVTGPSSAAWI
jgi:hypothetical protein